MKISHKVVFKKWARERYPQVETKIDHEGTQVLVITGKDGWNYKDYDLRGGKVAGYGIGRGDSRGKQVRISMNGPLKMTYAEWKQFKLAIDTAYIEAVTEADKL